MALSNATVWEVRPGAGSDANGGGFVAGASGTDYSQQNAAQYSASDLLVDASNDLLVTSASHAFAAADVGNLLQASGSGWTAGFYQITSVASGEATLDRSPAPTGTAGGAYAVGGALATVAAAVSAASACNIVWIKATAPYTVTAALALTLSSGGYFTSGAYFQFLGYSAVRGDGGQATWTTATASINLLEFVNSYGYFFANIQFTNTSGAPGAALAVNNNQGRIYNVAAFNCLFDGFLHAVQSIAYGNTDDLSSILLRYCEIRNCTSDGFLNAGGVFDRCFIHNNAGNGITLTNGGTVSGPSVLTRCVLFANTGAGILSQRDQLGCSLMLFGCDLVGNTGSGLKWAAQLGILLVEDSIVTENSAYGIESALTLGGTTNLISFQGKDNAFFNNASGNYSNVIPDPSDIALTADPFTDGAFTLNSTAGGGALCKGAAVNTLPEF